MVCVRLRSGGRRATLAAASCSQQAAAEEEEEKANKQPVTGKAMIHLTMLPMLCCCSIIPLRNNPRRHRHGHRMEQQQACRGPGVYRAQMSFYSYLVR